MKINFIRHISDDILKENQELKNTIIAAKQSLKSIYLFIKGIKRSLFYLLNPFKSIHLS